MENPMNKWMIWGEKTSIFGSTAISYCHVSLLEGIGVLVAHSWVLLGEKKLPHSPKNPLRCNKNDNDKLGAPKPWKEDGLFFVTRFTRQLLDSYFRNFGLSGS